MRAAHGQRSVHGSPKRVLQRPAPGLLLFDGDEQRLEVAFTERQAALALDDLEEQRRTILERLGKDLEHITEVVAVDENAEFAERLDALTDLTDALQKCVVVRRRCFQKLDAVSAQGLD